MTHNGPQRHETAQAADGRLPFVVFRCNGQGEQVGDYPALIRTEDLVVLLRQAGYGDGELPEEAFGVQRARDLAEGADPTVSLDVETPHSGGLS